MTAARRNPAVDAFLDAKAHPLRAEIDRLRDVILGADPRMAEVVKWGGPTFALGERGPNLGTIVLRGRAALTFFLPEGATLPNPHGLLTGDAAHVRTARFTSVAEIDGSAEAIAALVDDFASQHEGRNPA